MAAAASDVQNSSGTEQDNEPSLDVELLKETARKALIDTLNAVRSLVLIIPL
jgi:vacuolar protein sorting-associated protein 33A